MPHSYSSVSPIEKIISILSYFTMGFAGLIFVIIAYFFKKNIRYFLMYNIAQSMFISVLLAILSYLSSIIIKLLSLIPVLDVFSAKILLFLSRKIITIPWGMSFNLFQFIVFVLIVYICAGVIAGRILCVPVLTNVMNKAMKSYN